MVPLPLRDLSPNGYKHWRKVSAAKKAHRDECSLIAVNALDKFTGWPESEFIARVSMIWFMGPNPNEVLFGKSCKAKDRAYHPLDRQNADASMKAAIDGLVDAGMIWKDDHKHLKWGETELMRTKKEHCKQSGVKITVEVIG